MVHKGLESVIKLTTFLPHEAAIPLVGIYLREWTHTLQKDLQKIFTAALVRKGKEGINYGYSYTGLLFSNKKEQTAWVNLINMLNEGSLPQKKSEYSIITQNLGNTNL